MSLRPAGDVTTQASAAFADYFLRLPDRRDASSDQARPARDGRHCARFRPSPVVGPIPTSASVPTDRTTCLHHFHFGFDRPAQGRRRNPAGHDEPSRVDVPYLSVLTSGGVLSED